MHFSRLRLTGFKSFVEATDFRIEPGLTGVVGPNGCGKSNLLEALRWVMGANSAKAMRGEGMDDVIFAGSGARPGRNHAEVTLTIDNADHTAPAAFNAQTILEVSRRIDRGEGSTFRVNGAEARARDIQLLFADCSTGANSPALVRQGQISELIAARPQNRRRVLEEAAGVSGLHGRRHEAELRVAAARTNLDRLDDLAGELEANLNRLRREARHAVRYRTLSAEIRTLQAALLRLRWREARAQVDRQEGEEADLGRAAEQSVLAAVAAARLAAEADGAIKPRREEEMIAAGVLGRLAIDRDRLERAMENAAEAIRRHGETLARLEADAAREARIAGDAATTLERLRRDIGEVEALIASAPRRGPELEAAARTAEEARALADLAVENLAALTAAARAEAAAGETRLAEARERHGRTRRALDRARGEREALGAGADPRTRAAADDLTGAEARLEAARADLETADDAQAQAARAEESARSADRALQDALGRLRSEAEGLGRLLAGPADGRHAPVLERVIPEPGLEAAVAAVLGDDIDAALDPAAPSHWAAGRTPDQWLAAAPAWPKGAQPLSPLVSVPPELAGRLAFTALVARADGPRLWATLPPGARLVSREGDLWRWDGFTASAEAPRPAQVRLEQRTRLAAAREEIAGLEPRAAEASANAEHAASAAAAAVGAARRAREAVRTGEADALRAREAWQRFEREGARREAQIQSISDTVARFEVELTEAEAAVIAAEAGAAPATDESDLAVRLAVARRDADLARETAAGARAALDAETRDTAARARRLEELRGDFVDWEERASSAERRIAALAEAREAAERDRAKAADAPAEVELRRARLMDELATAEARRAAAGDALALAETARAQADRAARTAEAAAADARELHAGARARLEAARERLAEQAGALEAAADVGPEGAPEPANDTAGRSEPVDAERAESRLVHLERERDAMGPVNLMAETDAAELAARLLALNAERGDLSGALSRLHAAIGELNAEGRERLMAAFGVIDGHFRNLFTTLFEGGQAELRLVESDDPLEAGLEIFACPPGKRMAVMSLMSGGEQALTAVALIFAVFLANPAPICVLDEVDAPLDDANVERLCNLLAEMRALAPTRFVVITHNPLTMSRMDRLYGVTMREKGVSQLVSVDLRQAEAMAAQ